MDSNGGTTVISSFPLYFLEPTSMIFVVRKSFFKAHDDKLKVFKFFI